MEAAGKQSAIASSSSEIHLNMTPAEETEVEAGKVKMSPLKKIPVSFLYLKKYWL